ncbi:2-dehydropantoate 2-reductase [Piscibacillus sp. B03]|uniref:2-dehydropantoate 2-reductase n=1 Tax=Piscibacillus sp. B03 TaxID=3457430 RepID=UPI003FCCC810
MDIGIIGLGAVGLFMASKLSNRHQVTGYARNNEQIKQINDHGILIGNEQFNINIEHSTKFKRHDLIIVCVKQTHLKDLLPLFKTINHTRILFLQNGLGHVERVDQLNHDVVLGVCEHGVKKVSTNQVNLNGLGQIRIGSKLNSKLAQQIQKQINESSFPVIYDENILHTIQEKLVVNSVINPITALIEVKNGEILSNPSLKKIACKLSNEAAQFFGFNQDTCWNQVQRVAQNTKNNFSSMLVDIQAKRPTEIDYINGYIIKHSIELLPTQECMYDLIKAKENYYKRS